MTSHVVKMATTPELDDGTNGHVTTNCPSVIQEQRSTLMKMWVFGVESSSCSISLMVEEKYIKELSLKLQF